MTASRCCEKPASVSSGATRSFAEFIRAFRLERLPAEVIAQGKAILLDTLGAMLAASPPRYSAGRIIADLACDQGGNPECTLVGRRERTSCVMAALANGTLGYYCDIEAHHPGAIMHAAAIVVPAALAAAEKQGASGRALLEAVILGIEAACRVSYAVDPRALYARGFHPSCVCGGFGSAAAACRLLGLDAAETARALGLVGNQASGLLAWADDQTENSRPFNPGIAARNGVTAALSRPVVSAPRPTSSRANTPSGAPSRASGSPKSSAPWINPPEGIRKSAGASWSSP